MDAKNINRIEKIEEQTQAISKENLAELLRSLYIKKAKLKKQIRELDKNLIEVNSDIGKFVEEVNSKSTLSYTEAYENLRDLAKKYVHEEYDSLNRRGRDF